MRSEWTNLLGFFTTLEKTWWGYWEGKLKLMYFISGWMKTRICPFSSPMIWYYFIINTCYSKMAYDKDVITVISRPCRSRSWVPDRKQTYSHGQSPWGGTEVFIIFCNFYVPSWNSASFSKFSCSFPSPTLYKVETHKKKFWIQESSVVCGVRGEVGLVWIGKRPRNEKRTKSFNHHDCSYDLPDIKRALSPLRYGEVHKRQGNTWDSLLLWGWSVCYTCMYVSGMSLAQILSKRK